VLSEFQYILGRLGWNGRESVTTKQTAPREKYRPIRKIDSGGMAEVFQAEAEGIEGFKKEVAIKRVLPHLAENKKFISMFLDEARLSLRMNHGNVVQVFDIGMSENTYFIVMEYVDGSNFKSVLNHYRQRNRLLPVERSVYIIMRVCEGLNYAHNITDAAGKLLGIVHRDVSPPNILLSKEGAVKIVDFGLAKATSQLEHTDPGVVKGKFSYLSPEAAWGEEVDHRSDIFSAGIILYEALTGKRLFLGETDYQTVELVRRANIPSLRRINPSVSQDLEDIVRRSLARDKNDRYQSAHEFGDDLANFLFSRGLKVTTFDIADLVKGILNEEKASRRMAEPSIIDGLIQEEMMRFTSIDEVEPVSRESTPDADKPSGASPLNIASFEDPRAWGEDFEEAPAPPPESEAKQSALPVPAAEPSGRASVPPRPSRAPKSNIAPGTLAQVLEGEVRLVAHEPTSDRVLRFVKIALLALVAMGIGAVAAAIALGLFP